jgi:hypothetical protein
MDQQARGAARGRNGKGHHRLAGLRVATTERATIAGKRPTTHHKTAVCQFQNSAEYYAHEGISSEFGRSCIMQFF